MELARLLTAEGYSAVGLARSNSGLLEVPVRVGGAPATFLLDSGAVGTCFDQAAGDQPVSYVALTAFCVGPCSLPGIEAMMIDFSPVNNARQRRGDKPIDG